MGVGTMSEAWILRDTNRDTERELDSRSEAEDAREDLVGIGADRDDLEIIPPEDNGSDEIVVDADEGDGRTPELDDRGKPQMPTGNDLPGNKPSVDQDPVDWLPSHFIDNIQGTPTVNRKGYAVIASKYNVSVEAEPVVRASETGFEHAEFRAVATTEHGQTYSGFGSAHVDRQDGDDPYLLNELAETRSMKRAVAWATGVGMTAIEELQNP